MTTNTTDQAKPQIVTRDTLRGNIFNNAKPQSKLVTFFDTEIELRQPSVEEIESMNSENGEQRTSLVDMLIRYAFVPGTNDKMFESGDRETLRSMPFGGDMSGVTRAVSELSGIDISGAEKN